MRILVTGATGFIGRWLTPRLAAAGHEVVAVVRSSTETSGLSKAGTPFFEDDGVGDLLPALVAHGPFDGVIHLASLFIVAHTSDQVVPLLISNVAFPARLLDACARCGVRWFINTGTAWQHFEGRAYSPVNLYAATKQAFETLAQYYAEAHRLKVVTLALEDTYGPGDSRAKLLNLWCRIAQTGVPLDMSEGVQKIDLVYCADVAEAYRCAVDWLAAGGETAGALQTFHVSSGSCLSLRDLAGVFEEVTGASLPIHWGARPQRMREVMTPWDSRSTVPGWQPKVSLREGLARLWESATSRANGEGP